MPTDSTASTSTSTSASRSETRLRLLDAAESLFSELGFRSVTLRQITQAAGVNLASVNYHFGSKEALVDEVLTRVISPINRERLRLLSEAEARHGERPVPVEEILDCLHRPVVDQLADSPHQSTVFLKLAGRCLSEPSENFSDTLVNLLREMIERFLAAFSRSLPHLDEATLYWRMHLSFGAMVYALTHGDRIPVFSEGRVAHELPETTLKRIISFTAAGLRADSDHTKPVALAEQNLDSRSALNTDPPPIPAATEGRESTEPGDRSSRLRHTGGLAAFAALSLLTGCQNLAETLSPADASSLAAVEAPAQWVADPGSPHYHPIPDRRWISRFGAPELTRYLESVLAHNKELKAAQSRIEIASTVVRITSADLHPQIQGNFSGQRSQQNFIGFPFGELGGGPAGGPPPPSVLSSRSNQFGLSLDMSWEIDLWGRIRAATAASVAEWEASIFDYEAARLSLAGQAAKAWLAHAEGHEQVRLAESSLSVFGGTESLLRQRFEAGVEEAGGRSFAAERLLAEADTARAREALESRRELVARSARQLDLLAGRYPAGRAGSGATLPRFPSSVPAGLPGNLLDRRPDLAAAERRLAATDERLLEAKRAFLPAIGLTSRYGTSSEEIGDLLNGDFSIWSFAGNLAQPILQGGRLRANADRRSAERDLAVTEFEQAALVAFSEVENSLSTEGYLSKRVDALVAASRLTREAHERAKEEFEAGTGDVLTVLSTQERDFASRSQILTLRRMRLDNRIDLHLALGGDFRIHPAPEAKSGETPPTP